MSYRPWRAVLSTLILIFIIIPDAVAAEYQRGHKALEIWDDTAMANAPQLLNIWLMVMMASFALGLLFVWRHPIARWVVGGVLLSFLAAVFAVPALGLTPLSGLMALIHVIFWSPALYLLLKHRPFLAKFSAFGLWSGLVTAVILISFFFDIRDSAIYLDHMLGAGLLS